MPEHIRILLVEDNEGDIFLTMEAFRAARLSNHVDVVRDGEAALDFLYRRPPFAGALAPDLILLDINLPRVDGMEVLETIKYDESLKRIPVIMLTTSDAERDVLRSYENHANCYITKPVAIEQFMNVIQSLKDFWVTIVKLPKTN